VDAIPTIEEYFEAFCKAELPGKPPEEVARFVKETFYAGAGSMLRAVDRIKRTADTPMAGIIALERLDEELACFAADSAARLIAEALGCEGVMVMRVRRKE
jgi:hypothetical protein